MSGAATTAPRKEKIGDRDGIEAHHHSRRCRGGIEVGKRPPERCRNSRIDRPAKAVRFQSERSRGHRAVGHSETLAYARRGAQCACACRGQGSIRTGGIALALSIHSPRPSCASSISHRHGGPRFCFSVDLDNSDSAHDHAATLSVPRSVFVVHILVFMGLTAALVSLRLTRTQLQNAHSAMLKHWSSVATPCDRPTLPLLQHSNAQQCRGISWLPIPTLCAGLRRCLPPSTAPIHEQDQSRQAGHGRHKPLADFGRFFELRPL
jgi:hypothetical protein